MTRTEYVARTIDAWCNVPHRGGTRWVRLSHRAGLDALGVSLFVTTCPAPRLPVRLRPHWRRVASAVAAADRGSL